jgi:hypothetical protein
MTENNLESISIQPSRDNNPDTENRFTKNDIIDNIIMHFEAEFDTFMNPETKWGITSYNVTFFCQNGKLYYYKPAIEQYIKTDSENFSENIEETEIVKESLSFCQQYLGYNLHEKRRNNSIENIKLLIESNAFGMPKFLNETPHFYEFENPIADDDFLDPSSTHHVHINNIDRQLLNKAKDRFISDWNPLLSDMSEHLYIGKDGELYFLDLLSWINNPDEKTKIGIWMDTKSGNIPYSDKHIFYPFSDLTQEEYNFVKKIAALMCDDSENSLVIRYI